MNKTKLTLRLLCVRQALYKSSLFSYWYIKDGERQVSKPTESFQLMTLHAVAEARNLKKEGIEFNFKFIGPMKMLREEFLRDFHRNLLDV